MILVRRPRPRGHTDGDGYKKPGTPQFWPFGMSRPVLEKAKVGEARKAKIKAILKSLKD